MCLQQLSAGVCSLITTHHTGTLILRSATCSQTSTWVWFQAQAEPSPNAPRMESAAPWMLQSVLESSSEMLSAPICGFLHHLDEEGFYSGGERHGASIRAPGAAWAGDQQAAAEASDNFSTPTKKVQYIVYLGTV